jgi:RHS repeat-associated protein
VKVSVVTNNTSPYRSYDYDANGNVAGDGDFTYEYNSLDLPRYVKVSGTPVITYTYDAAGRKLRRATGVLGTGTTDYVSGLQYSGSGNMLDFIQTEEGRYIYSSGKYQYNLTDHLGNVRVVLQRDGDNTGVEQENEYYAFGLNVNRTNVSPENKYLYNGKELQEDYGWNRYDYGARFYDPVTGRFNTVDPLADQFPWQSGYASFDNNPINKIDPDGRAAYSPIYGTDGTLLGTDDEGLKGKAIVMDQDKFKQGMKHEDALKNNLGWKGFEDDAAKSKFATSYNSLSSRPDYDGHVTLDEANKWYREGNGQPLFADLSKVDLSAIKQGDFKTDRKVTYFQTLFNSKDGRVYGNIGLSLENGRARGTYDTYDFDVKPYTNKTTITPAELIIRNAATQIGNAVAGNGTGYRIYFNGTAPIKK